MLQQFIIIAKSISNSSWYVYSLRRSVYFCVLHVTSPIWCFLFQLLTLIPASLQTATNLHALVYFVSLACIIKFSSNHRDQICHSQVCMISLCVQFAIIRLTNATWKQMHKQNITFAAAIFGWCKGQKGVWLDPGNVLCGSRYVTLCSVSILESSNPAKQKTGTHKHRYRQRKHNWKQHTSYIYRLTHNIFKKPKKKELFTKSHNSKVFLIFFLSYFSTVHNPLSFCCTIYACTIRGQL